VQDGAFDVTTLDVFTTGAGHFLTAHGAITLTPERRRRPITMSWGTLTITGGGGAFENASGALTISGAVLLVAKIAGHSRPSVTLDVYSHLFDSELAEAATRYDPLRREPRLRAVDER
jgi:integrase